MTEQPNDQKKPHGVDFSFNYQFSYDDIDFLLWVTFETIFFDKPINGEHVF